jgi:predicted kinase
MGDLASGKSTFANMLSKRYDTVLFCKDPIKETLGNTFGFSNRAENLKLSYATAELMYLILSEFGKVNQDLILESNFRIGELEKLHKIAADNAYQVLTLVLRGDVEILHKRYLNRMHHENRPAVHLCAEFNTIDGFGAYLESLRTPTVPGSVIWINANDFSYQTDAEILNNLDEFMKD